MHASQFITLADNDSIEVVLDAHDLHGGFVQVMAPDAAGGSVSIDAAGEAPADTIQRLIDALTKLRGAKIAQAGGDPVTYGR